MKGISFGNYHSYDDFGLLLSSKEIGSPEPKIITIDVEGSDGVLDFTEFAGETKFRNRSLTFHFSKANVLDDFMTLFSQVHNAIHGQKLRIVLDDDPEFYYVGRITVNEFMADANIGRITVECDCEPWKYKMNVTREKVFLYGKNLFDSSSIEQGTINNSIGSNIESAKTQNNTRIRQKNAVYIKPSTKYTITIPSGFDIAVRAFDKNEIMVYTTGWRNVTFSFITGAEIESMALTIRYSNDASITPESIVGLQFQIEEGDASEYEPFVEESTVSVSINNLRKKTIPIIHASGHANIKYENTSIALQYSTGYSPDLAFKEGANDLTITGKGSVLFEFQEGGL